MGAKHCDPSYIFSGVQDPIPRSTPLAMADPGKRKHCITLAV